MQLPEFDELFVVSDLHLGGPAGFQIFDCGARLAATVRGIAAREASRVALVLAGDVVDLLAENPATYLDVARTRAKLDRIRQDPAFRAVFDALGEFVKTPGRALIVVLGNHDVELALPAGRRWLHDTLAGDDAAARGRISLALDGWGYSANVGGRRVLCVHGNEVDDWNVIDHLRLLQVNRALERGVEPPEWNVNGGTRLVVDVMNRVKRKYPFVDLLKPETKAALPVVAALDPDNVDLGGFLRAVARKTRDGLRMRTGFLGGEPEPTEAATDDELFDEFFASAYADDPSAPTDDDARDELAQLLWAADNNIRANRDARASGPTEGMLGAMDRIRDFFRGEDGVSLMRKALAKWLGDDTTFALDEADPTFTSLDEIVGPDVDYLIAGHTHLRRALERRRAPGRYYFNSGTWIRLIQLRAATLADDQEFSRVWKALSAGSIEALDSLNDLGPDGDQALVTRVSTVVGIIDGSRGTYGALFDASDDGALSPVAGSRLPAR